MNPFDEIIIRENTNSVKYDLRQLYFRKKEVIPMWVADMDFPTPDFIQNAIKKRAEHPVYGYSIKPNSYFNSIINWMEQKHQWKIKKNEIAFSPGVVPGLVLSLMAFTNPGDKIVVQPPVYFPFFTSVIDNDRQLLHNELIEKNNEYSIDFEDLEKKLSDSKTSVLLISNPHNPVGRAWKQWELEKMLNLCKKHHVLLFSDEIHSDLVFPKYKHIVAANINEDAKNRCITFMAPSKTFNIAGLSTSFLVIQDAEKRRVYKKTLEAYHLGMGNIFGNEALEAAYNNGHSWLNYLMDYLQQNVDLVECFLKKNIPQITFTKPEATYLLWLNCKSLHLTDKKLQEFFIEKANLGLNSGDVFGLGGSGYMRMNIACPSSTLKTALNQLQEAINEINL